MSRHPADVRANRRTFRRLLVNTLLTGVTSSFVWFALIFWVYLETRSVVATGVIGAAYGLSAALVGPVFGAYVDRHRKHRAMVASTVAMLVCLGLAAAVYAAVDTERLLAMRRPWFWVLTATTLLGAVAGQMRSIALSTCVTLLVPVEDRDRANGMVGTVTGASFAITSVFSGLAIGTFGMGWAFAASVVVTVSALGHLMLTPIVEEAPSGAAHAAFVDWRGAVEAIRSVPGLMMLVLLAAFNNLLGGVFMALMDAYGLELVAVEVWGLLWGLISLSFIVGGLAVGRFGLGGRPLRWVMIGNLVNWIVCVVFPIRSSIVLLTVGMIVWLGLVPVIEAAEQTVLQRAVPFEVQGRVFGFAQFVENAAAPAVALVAGPLAEGVAMPSMTDGRAAAWIGDWFGRGPDRGLALMFTLAGVIGVAVTVTVWGTRAYRSLSAAIVATPDAVR